MKKTILFITTILFVVITSQALATDLAKWQYRCEITFDGGAEKYAKAALIPEVYDVAKTDMSDVRIVDSKGLEVPYLIVKPSDIAGKHKYPFRIINRSTDAENNSLVTLDFGRQIIKNHIEVETQGQNFRRAAKVEGSNDNVAFFTLVERAFIFAVDNKEKDRFSNIDLPVNDYRYLRVTISPMVDEQQSPVIQELGVFNCDEQPADRAPMEMVLLSHTVDDENNLSIYEYDVKFRNLPLSEIQLGITDESFYRRVSVQGRNVHTQKVKIDSEDNRQRYREVEQNWEYLTGGTVYRYRSTQGREFEKTTLSIPPGKSAYRHLKVTISNYNDRPLNIEAVSAAMVTHQIIFDAASKSDVWLYVGSEFARKPEYDIRHRLDKPLEVKATSARLGHLSENSLFGNLIQAPKPWTEEHRILLLIIIAAVMLVLGVFILKSFKSIQTDQAQKQ